jgi:hypothetical protein
MLYKAQSIQFGAVLFCFSRSYRLIENQVSSSWNCNK